MRLPGLLCFVALSAIGYAIWRMSQGGQRTADHSRDLHRALNEDQGRMNLATGRRGMAVDVDDPGGGHARRMVGRGVLRNA
jgi:hypothetical protein